MMPPLMPSLDTAVSATAVPPAGSADGAAVGNVFSALIQGLQPTADTTATSLLSLKTTDLAVLPAVQALPASTDTLASTSVLSALASVLNDLGLNESSTEPELDTKVDVSAEDVTSSPEASAVSPTILPAVPLLLPTLSEATRSEEAAAMDVAVTPAQSQVRQWLAAFAPAAMSSDSPGTVTADTLDGQRAPVPPGLPTAPAVPVSNAWVQQPLAAAFLNMSSGAEPASGITERFGLSLESSAVSLPTDAAKGLTPAISFAQQMSSPQSSAPVLTTLLPHALQDPAWSEAFGQRIAMLAQQGTQSATLQLNPPDLGPIQVRIAMSEHGAKVEFNTLQQTTSDLIETAMPRLAAALEHQGLRLDDSRVNLLTSRQDVFNAQSAFSSARQDTPQGERGQATPQSSRSSIDMADAESDRLPGTVIKLPESQKRGIDYYA